MSLNLLQLYTKTTHLSTNKLKCIITPRKHIYIQISIEVTYVRPDRTRHDDMYAMR